MLKSREDTKKLDEEIVGYINPVGAQFITEATPSTEATVSPSTPHRKRQLSAENVGAPFPKRRRCYGTPKQRILSRTVVTGTPSASVSSVTECGLIYVQ